MTEPIPPKRMANVEAEQAVLGCMLLAPSAGDEVLDLLCADDFYEPKHGKIFALLSTLIVGGQPTDPISVAHLLDEDGDLQRVGGVPYLHTLVSGVSIGAQIAYYAKIVRDWSIRRRVFDAAVIAGQSAQNLAKPVDDVLETASSAILRASLGQAPSTMEPVGVILPGVLGRIKQRVAGDIPLGLTTGLLDLDALLAGGWQPGQLILPAGRPSQGKSVATLGFVKAAAKAGRPSMMFALEMQKQELSERLLADEASVNYHAIRSGELTEEEMDKLSDAEKRLSKLPMYIDDKANSIAKVQAEARRFKQRHGDLGLVAVDYLQRLSTSSDEKRRDLEVGDNAKAMKDLAMALDTTAMAVCQLNRQVEQRADKRPMMSDLRDSGQLEQEGDIIIMLYRDEYYNKKSPRSGEVDFIVVKNRNGEPDTVTFASQLHYQRFVDMYR